jgi:hypothetical protein
MMPNKYNDPQGGKTLNNRPPTPLEQSNRDEDVQYQRAHDAENGGAAKKSDGPKSSSTSTTVPFTTAHNSPEFTSPSSTSGSDPINNQ